MKSLDVRGGHTHAHTRPRRYPHTHHTHTQQKSEATQSHKMLEVDKRDRMLAESQRNKLIRSANFSLLSPVQLQYTNFLSEFQFLQSKLSPSSQLLAWIETLWLAKEVLSCYKLCRGDWLCQHRSSQDLDCYRSHISYNLSSQRLQLVAKTHWHILFF